MKRRSLLALALVWAVTVPAWAAVALTSSTSAVSVASSTITTPTITTTGATILVAILNVFNGVLAMGTVTDLTAGCASPCNTWTKLTSHFSNGGNVEAAIFYVVNPTVGTGHSFTGGAGASTYPALCVAAFSGIATSTPFDSQNGADNIAANTAQPGSLAVSTTGDLYISGAEYLDATSVSTVNSSFTLQENQASDATVTHVGCSLAYLISTSTSAVNPTFTAVAGGGIRTSALIATFKAGAGGGATSHPCSALRLLGVGCEVHP